MSVNHPLTARDAATPVRGAGTLYAQGKVLYWSHSLFCVAQEKVCYTVYQQISVLRHLCGSHPSQACLPM